MNHQSQINLHCTTWCFLVLSVALFFFLPFNLCFGAKLSEDSLQLVIKGSTNARERLEAMIALSDIKLADPKDKRKLIEAKKLIDRAQILIKEIKYSKGLGLVSKANAKYCYTTDDYLCAVQHYEQAAVHFKQAKELKSEAFCYQWLCFIFDYSLSDNKKRILNAHKILQLKKALISIKEYPAINFAYYTLGEHYRKIYKTDSSNYYLQKSITFSEQYHSDYLNASILFLYNMLGQNDFAKALILAQKIIKKGQDDKSPKYKMWGWSSIGTIYSKLGDFSRSAQAFDEAVKNARQLNEQYYIQNFKLSAISMKARLYPERNLIPALESLMDSMEIEYPCLLDFEEMDKIYIQQHQPQKALAFYDDIIRRAQNCNDVFHLAQSMALKATLLADLKQFRQARVLALKAYQQAKEAKDPEIINGIETLLARLEGYVGNVDKAEYYYQKSKKFQDSLEVLRSQAIAKITESTQQYLANLKTLEQEKKLWLVEKQKRQLTTIFLGLGFLALLVLIGLIVERLRKAKELRTLIQELIANLDFINNSVIQNTQIFLPADHADQQQSSFSIDLVNTIKESTPKEKQLISKLDELTQTICNQQKFAASFKKEAAQNEEQLRAFTYSISHDLKSPLENAKRIIELLQLKYAPLITPQLQLHIEDFILIIQQMDEMIDGIAAFSYADHTAMNLKSTDLSLLFTSITHQLAAIEPDTKLDFIHLETPIPAVYGDPLLLRQMFYNLLSNAVKFTKGAASPHIQISGKDLGSSSLITIADNGAGIPLAAQPRLFQLFFSAHDRQQFAGTGAGLAIAKRIVDRHGGSIRIESAGENQGTTVYVELPK
jgi:signal transduction histidine kinase